MFNFLKDKLKEWVGKAKETIVGAEKKEEIKEKPKKIKEKPKKEQNQKQKKEKKKIGKKQKVKEKIIEEEPKLKPEESGTAIKIEQEIEEGVPQEIIDEELKEEIKKKEIKKEREISEKIVEDIAHEEKGFFSKLKERFREKQKKELEEEKQLEEERIEEKIEEVKEKGFFSKLKEKFSYKISEEDFNKLFEDLEMLLLENNVALEAVEDLGKRLKEKLIAKEIKKENLEEEIRKELKSSLNEILIEPDNPLDAIKGKKRTQNKPFVILFFGINGTGKTTTIAKIAHLLQKNNLSVVLAAADTFRAASIEQIQIHADKLKVPLVKHDYGSDPSAVGFDAIKYAEKHRIDAVLIDTAGRMHTKTNLLAEMEKICRVTNPDLKIFVAESIAGNDATEQARAFNDMIEIDGSILSKADIDEKGGTIISVSYVTHKPIFYLGTGQEYKDLKLFDKQEFIKSLGL